VVSGGTRQELLPRVRTSPLPDNIILVWLTGQEDFELHGILCALHYDPAVPAVDRVDAVCAYWESDYPPYSQWLDLLQRDVTIEQVPSIGRHVLRISVKATGKLSEKKGSRPLEMSGWGVFDAAGASDEVPAWVVWSFSRWAQ